MTYEKMIELEKEYWNKVWNDPIPEPEDSFRDRPLTERDIPWLLHIFGMNLSLGQTKQERRTSPRKWTKEKLTEYCQRCMKLTSPLLERIVDLTWYNLGQFDARRQKSVYRDVPPPELDPLIIPSIGDDIIYEKNGVTCGRCIVKEKTPKGWIGATEEGEIVSGTDLEVVEIVLFDSWK